MDSGVTITGNEMTETISQKEKQRARLIGLLKELFQLDQPDLDFGFYKIMHAKAGQVSDFLEKDLLTIIKDSFGEADEVQVAEARAAYEAAKKQAADFGAPDPEATEPVKKAKAAFEAAKDSGSNEGDVYDHLYRFFERYYDGGDFMSRRYFARETDGKAAPYAVPYDGREVYLHWANRDQYYIKTSDYLTNFTFDLLKSEDLAEGVKKQAGVESLPVHCRVKDASEGDHNNVKASEETERFFVLHEENPVVVSDEGLILQFEYKPLPGKKYPLDADREKELKATYGASKKGDLPILDMADKILAAIPEEGEAYKINLQTIVETDKIKKRPLLAKYLNKYTARNTMDYFIHKDLGGFLRRELDFYIKNEVMRLDDLEDADAPRVETYLAKVKVLRKIARHLIEFLAQLEDFQKKLWLKKKFVVETNYCITLDRIPEAFYEEIAANEAQREEWVKLFAIDEIEADLSGPGYSTPLTVDFLKTNDKLLVDTAFYDTGFKEKLLAELENLDEVTNGELFHSENFQALNFMLKKRQSDFDAVYIDPPYNTSASEIIYKNAYKHSSWMSLIENRISVSQSLMNNTALMCTTIDDVEFTKLYSLIENQFSSSKIAGVVPIRINPSGRPTEKGFALTHEYAIFSSASKSATIYKMPRSEAQLSRFKEKDEKSIFEWRNLRREGSNSDRGDGERQYFPIYAELENGHIRVPEMQWIEESREWRSNEDPKAHEVVIWPVNDQGREKNWRWSEENIRKDYSQFLARIPRGGTAQVYYKYRPNLEGTTPLTLWAESKYSATEHGTQPLKDLFKEPRFSYPKSIYAVEDCLSIMGMRNNNTRVLDYFAGSGTTAHAVINISRNDGLTRKFTLCEMGNYFDDVTLPRVKKVIFSSEWSDGKPAHLNKAIKRLKKQVAEYNKEIKEIKGICSETEYDFHYQRLKGLIEYSQEKISRIEDLAKQGNSLGALSQIIKYIRLESYEDALNNLAFKEGAPVAGREDFRRDYMLNYWLKFETQGSPSLLNVEAFADPTAYTLKVKKPGSDEHVSKNVDLVETFNWLIGLHVEHLDCWRGYSANTKREEDPELPEDSTTRLVLDGRMVETDEGAWQFRKVEGYTLPAPGDKSIREKTLVIWRKLTGDMEADNLMLDEWFKKYRLSTHDTEFDVIYVNGSNNLPNLRQAEETWKVRLIEEHFHTRMWDMEG